MQLLEQLKENKENNKEVCTRMKANDGTKLLQESQKKPKKGDFKRGEKEAMVKKQNRKMLRSN